MTRHRSDEELEAMALNVRRALGTEQVPAPSMMSVIKSLPRLSGLADFSVRIVRDGELSDAEAYADCDRKQLVVRESVFAALLDGLPRARMTIAHEIAHLLLGHRGAKFRATGKDLRSLQVPETRAAESEAKRFAGYFLALYTHVLECQTAEEIARKCHISLEAAQIRLAQVESRLRKDAGRSRELPSSVIDFLEEERKRGHPVRSIGHFDSVPKRVNVAVVTEREHRANRRIFEAHLQGFARKSCGECGNLTLDKDGNCLTCRTCGDTGLAD